MPIFAKVETFLRAYCLSSAPLLLALSGGPDSLCLFYCLLEYQRRHGLSFHIAHVDHGWRPESKAEAQALQQLALEHQIPFHLKVLDPTSLKGNLEAACREERYAFFAELGRTIPFQGVLTGHHQDDQAETLFKRMMEGAHWSRWIGLKPEHGMHGIRILRPLLAVSKEEIRQMLAQKEVHAFEDPTNHDTQYLRARLRTTIFPRLNQEFGKQVQKSFIEIGEEIQELTHYFEGRLSPLLDHCITGPWGTYLDLQQQLPASLLEIKYLIRFLCAKLDFFLSREIIEHAAKALLQGKANQLFVMGTNQIWVDRKRLFILHSPLKKEDQPLWQEVSPGLHSLGSWQLKIEEEVYTSSSQFTSWKEGWQGHLKAYLPVGTYKLGFNIPSAIIKKRWSQAKVPNFLAHFFPLVWTENEFCHEFLTGKPMLPLREGAPCLILELTSV